VLWVRAWIYGRAAVIEGARLSGGVGRSAGDGLVDAFAAALTANGLSSYTQRSNALGVRHFLRWLADEAVELEGGRPAGDGRLRD
jgi:hypothetical protein